MPYCVAVTDDELRLDTTAGRRLLATTVLGSGMVFLDGTITNVALPRIGRELDADLAGLQWVVNGYALSLAALIVVGGSLGDHFGRKRVYALGVLSFVVASVAVALAPTIHLLVCARVVQGVAAAALTPGSLAMLQSAFGERDRLKAIGAWSGMLGIATAAGPVVGGWLVGIDWRYGFWLNVPLGALVLWLLRDAPESSDPDASHRFDVPAIVLTVTMLAGLTWALTDWRAGGPFAAAVAVVSAVALVVAEKRSSHPMIPLVLFRNRIFTWVNVATLFVYASFTGSMFFVALFLQVSAGWSPLEAGAASLPISLIMLVLSGYFGGVAQRRGALVPMVGGMTLVAVGFALLALAPANPTYVRDILPGVSVQGFGMSMLVSPLTGTVLAAAPSGRSGLASGINNAVSRTAGLVAVAALPMLVGLVGSAYQDGERVAEAFGTAMWWCVGSVLLGAMATAVGLESDVRRRASSSAEHAGVPAHHP